MESDFRVFFTSTHERRSCELHDVTLDEAVSFAIILFQKYARIPGDQCLIYKEIDKIFYDILVRTITLTRDNTMEVKLGTD